MQEKHVPVLLSECIEALNIKLNGVYVDLTLGRAGHSSEILKKIPNGKLFCFDKDISAINKSRERLLQVSNNFELIHSDYKNINNELMNFQVNLVDGILADLGVSSPQLDDAERGFSYSKDARLDMRMNQKQELNAHTIVNEWNEQSLIDIFKEFGDVPLPQKIAKGIILKRPINNTMELVNVIRESLPAAIVRKKNPSKPVFQAIRIAVNNEIDSLKEMLTSAISLLKVGSSIAIITFHSIEDRVVKKIFGTFIKDDTGKLPIIIEKKWKTKTFKPKKIEIETNRRSRSAKLRVLTRLG